MIKGMKYLIILAVLLLTVFPGCKGPAGEPDPPTYRSYRDIPGVTSEEIRAIEALKGQRDSFVYAMRPSTEAFRGEDGEIRGFSALVCEWLTGLFGIPFKPALARWDDLFAGLETHDIDFTGDLGATAERRKIYFMTSAIAERVIKTFRIEGSAPLAEIAASRPLRCVFLRDATAITRVTNLLQNEYEIILVNNNDSAYEMLKSGEADVYFTVDVSQAEFEAHGDVVVSDFFPLVLNPVSLSTQNPALAPVISVVQKALDNDSIRYLAGLYELGYQEYEKHMLFTQFSAEEIAYIQSHPTVRFAAVNTNYPISFYNTHEKKWQGVAFDVLQKVEALTGLHFELAHDHNVYWQDSLSILKNGEAAMLAGIVHSNTRRELFLWTDTPIMSDSYALISKSDYSDISLNEILYVKIGIVNDTAYAEVFNRWFPDHQYTVEYQDVNDAIDALERGEVDMIMASQGQLLMITHYRELTGYKANVIFNFTFESAFPFNRNEPVLCSIIDKTLKIIDTKIISERWTHKTYDYQAKIARVQLPWIVGAIALLFTVLFVGILLFRKHGEGKRLESLVKARTVELNRQHNLTHKINNAALSCWRSRIWMITLAQ